MDSKFDLLLHPIRIRILMAVAGRTLTPKQMAALISDVPQTTLYRHINALVEGQILTVVGERQVRGTLERSYAMIEGAGLVSADDAAAMSSEDHLRFFLTFLMTLMQDFTKYVAHAEAQHVPPTEALYNKVPLYLTPEERQTLLVQTRALLLPYMSESLDETPRQRYLFGSVAIPDTDLTPDEDGDPK